MTTKAIAYYRVSTQKQGQSGLGLEAQQAAVESFCKQRGFQLCEAFTEVESGKYKSRPQLDAALFRAKQEQATLIVAKMDRLSRNAGFLIALRDSDQKFIAADNPDVNEFTVGILALVAEEERKAISARTCAALSAARRRGTKLGNPNGAAALRRSPVSGPETRKQIAKDAAQRLAPIIQPMRTSGMTLQKIAEALNANGFRTPRNRKWYPCTVRDVLNRL